MSIDSSTHFTCSEPSAPHNVKTKTVARYLESYMTSLQLEGVLRGHVVLLQQVSLLRVQGVTVGDGGCDGHLVVGVLLVHNAVVEQQPAVGLGSAPCKHRLPCTDSNQSFHLQ